MTEIYADLMSALTVSKRGDIVKFIFSTELPDDKGKIVQSRALVLTLPAHAADVMLEDIQKARRKN